jgi:predicted RNA-binding Zn-ribbon protein involved in translation (DUF1610 family)
MQFACPLCGGRVINAQCEDCLETYIMVCSKCGNNMVFEEIAVGNEVIVRCANCDNETDLQMVSLV